MHTHYIPGTNQYPGARSILDAAEFARLARRHRKVGVHIRDHRGNSYAYTYVAADKILGNLERGDLDGLIWTAEDDGVDISGWHAPEVLRLRRAIERHRATVADYTARLERYATRAGYESTIEWYRRDLAIAQRELAAAETRLRTLRQQATNLAA